MAISDSEKSKRQLRTNDSSCVISNSSCHGSNSSRMEYGWLEPKHDPIATDTNLAEIDFEDFRNEDLAYAFSCGVRIKRQSVTIFSAFLGLDIIVQSTVILNLYLLGSKSHQFVI